MKVLVFDTETTGLPLDYNAPVHDSSKWPHIVQLSFILYDTEQKTVLNYSDCIIDIDPSVHISPESIAVHHITAERCHREGLPIREVLTELGENVDEADIIVGHNIMFDKRMLMAELHRHNLPNFLYCNKNFQTVPDYCTMKRTTELCKIPVVNKNTGKTYNKWPTLSELHNYLFANTPYGTHDAMADVLICLRCYIQLIYKYDIVHDEKVQPVLRALVADYCTVST
jgi:DNA polymerase-3 subunit epsilon